MQQPANETGSSTVGLFCTFVEPPVQFLHGPDPAEYRRHFGDSLFAAGKAIYIIAGSIGIWAAED